MRLLSGLVCSTILSSAMMISAVSAEPKVVTSIKPVHSLVAGVMEGVGEPTLLVKGNASPHDFSLKPSDAAALQEADTVFWVGHMIEGFLEDAIETVATKAHSIELIEARGIETLEFREDEGFEAHDHGDHDEHGHKDHDHDDHAEKKDDHDHDHSHDDHKHDETAEAKEHDHDHDEHKHDDHKHGEAKEEHSHDDHDHGHKEHAEAEGHGHDHGEHEVDGHIWLDPENARLMVAAIAEELAEHDASNADKYKENAAKLDARLAELTKKIAGEIAPVATGKFVVFHDAYQYFERRFGLQATGSITVSPEVAPSANRIQEIREKITTTDASCVFSEPQFQPRIVSVVTEGTPAKTAVLDPLGANLTDGPDLYFQLIENMAAAFSTCLSKTN